MECRNKYQILLPFLSGSVSQDFGINSYTAITLFVLIFTELSTAQKRGDTGLCFGFSTWSSCFRNTEGADLHLEMSIPFHSWNAYSKPGKFKSLIQGYRIPFFLHAFGSPCWDPNYTQPGAGKAVPRPFPSSEFSCIKGLIYENKQPHKSWFKPSPASWGFVLIKVLAHSPEEAKNSSNFDSTKAFIRTKISTRTHSNMQWRDVWFRHSD